MTLSELLTCTRKVKEINFKLNSSTKITTAEESDDKRNQEKKQNDKLSQEYGTEYVPYNE